MSVCVCMCVQLFVYVYVCHSDVFTCVPCLIINQVKVCHVSNATRLWVSLLEHLPLRRGDPCAACHDRSVFTKVSLELAEYYADSNNRQLHGEHSVGIYCWFLCVLQSNVMYI